MPWLVPSIAAHVAVATAIAVGRQVAHVDMMMGVAASDAVVVALLARVRQAHHHRQDKEQNIAQTPHRISRLIMEAHNGLPADGQSMVVLGRAPKHRTILQVVLLSLTWIWVVHTVA